MSRDARPFAVYPEYNPERGRRCRTRREAEVWAVLLGLVEQLRWLLGHGLPQRMCISWSLSEQERAAHFPEGPPA